MQNRTRNKQIILRFTEDEAEYFKNYKAKSQISAYIDFVLHLLTYSQLFVIRLLSKLTTIWSKTFYSILLNAFGV